MNRDVQLLKIYSLLRLVFGVFTIVTVIGLWPEIRFHFLTDAIYPAQEMFSDVNNLTGWSLLKWISLDGGVYLFFILFFTSAVCMALGLFSRISTLICFICMVSVMRRALYLGRTVDTIIRMTEFYLFFAPTGYFYSLDKILFPKKITEVNPWPWRALFLQFLIIYLVAGIGKIYGDQWTGGQGASLLLLNWSYGRYLPVKLLLQTGIPLEPFSYFAFLFEIFAAPLLLIKFCRKYVVATGLIFHTCVLIFFQLDFISWGMLALYILFMNERALGIVDRFFAKMDSLITPAFRRLLKLYP